MSPGRCVRRLVARVATSCNPRVYSNVRWAGLREDSRRNQQGLAEKAGVMLPVLPGGPTAQGLTPEPRVGTLLALSQGLGVDMNRLPEGMKPRPRQNFFTLGGLSFAAGAVAAV